MMTYDELDRRCIRLHRMKYGYRKQADAMRAHIAELEQDLETVTSVVADNSAFRSRNAELKQALEVSEALLLESFPPISTVIFTIRTALERKP